MRAILLAFSFLWLPVLMAAEPVPKTDPPKTDSLKKGAEAPAEPTTAIILGRRISAKPGDELNGMIIGTLFNRYAEEMKLTASDAEIEAFNNAMERKRQVSVAEWKQEIESLEKEILSPTLSEDERKAARKQIELNTSLIEGEKKNDEQRKSNPAAFKESRALIATQFLVGWKLSQSLFQKYGGRVIVHQSGPEPLDAFRDFLKAREKAGDFTIFDEEGKRRFWEYFTNDNLHTFYNDEEGRKRMTTPWWLGE